MPDNKKEIRPFHVNGSGPAWKKPEGQAPLFAIERLACNGRVLVVAGEKAADAAQKLFPGWAVTTSISGEASAAKTDWSLMRGKQVTIWPDADQPGEKYAIDVAELCLKAGARSIHIVDVPLDAPKGWDLADEPPQGWDLPMMVEEAIEYSSATAEAPPKPPLLPLLLFTQWQGKQIPERQWLVPDWIPWGYVSALYGDGGTGKSLLAQQLVTAVATGSPWLRLPVTQSKAIALFCEDDDDELLRRQADINRHLGLDFCDLSAMDVISNRVGEDNVLMDFTRDGKGEVTELFQRFRETAIDFGATFAVVDTAADTFGGNELKRPEVRQFISACLGALARDIGGTVLMCAHPSVRGMADGSGTGASTAWSNTVRSRMYLTRSEAEDGVEDNNARVLTRRKTNYASIGAEILLRWECGVFRVDGKVEGGWVEAIDERAKEQADDETFLACLDEVDASGRYASSTCTSSNYAPKLFMGCRASGGRSKRQLKAAMNRLFASGRIKVAPRWTGARNRVQAIEKVEGPRCG